MALSSFNELLTSIADRGRSIIGLASPGPGRITAENVTDLCQKLLSSRGEASGIALSFEILSRYGWLSDEAKTRFFQILADRFSASQETVLAAAEAYLADPSPAGLVALGRASEPPRMELLMRLNQTPAAMKSLVEMRSDLLDRLRDRPELAFVDHDFVRLFTSWFNRGFLELRKIDWNTPAAILEKIIRYEAVHGMSDWNDLRQRIDPPDRDIYGFFHPTLGDEPLIFVEVALMEKSPASIDEILKDDRSLVTGDNARTAVFYSISNCQHGLRGIPLGSFLIKQVVESLQKTQPGLKEYVTLSPVPSLAKWLSAEMEKPGTRFSEETRSAIGEIMQTGWQSDPSAEKRLRAILLPAVAWYLSRQKNAGGKPEDPVARFHLGNGAQLERINWAADLSANGMASSFGIMVNYKYRLEQIERNHEQYVNSGTVSVSGAISRMASSFENKLAPETDRAATAAPAEAQAETDLRDDSAAA